VLAACLLTPSARGQQASATSTNISTVLTVQNKVEILRARTEDWLAAKKGDVLQIGDRLRTGEDSRATVRLYDRSVLQVGELTTYEIQPPRKGKTRPSLDVKKGLLYFFSRQRGEEMSVTTPTAVAAIRGTELSVQVDEDGRTVLALLDGEADLTNEQGRLALAAGEQAAVESGRSPGRTATLAAAEAIQWVLYYPAVIEVEELGLSEAVRGELAASLEAYRQGDVLQALERYPAGRRPGSDAERVYRAALALAVGKTEEARGLLDGLNGLNGLNERAAEAGGAGGANVAKLAGALRRLVAAVKGGAAVAEPEETRRREPAEMPRPSGARRRSKERQRTPEAIPRAANLHGSASGAHMRALHSERAAWFVAHHLGDSKNGSAGAEGGGASPDAEQSAAEPDAARTALEPARSADFRGRLRDDWEFLGGSERSPSLQRAPAGRGGESSQRLAQMEPARLEPTLAAALLFPAGADRGEGESLDSQLPPKARAQSAIAPGLTLASEWLAESYYQQSRSRLSEALAAAHAAARAAPESGFAWARVGELEFSFGRIAAARAATERSLRLAPRHAPAHALKGFLLAAEDKIDEALASFEQALTLDGALGTAWLGRGLCKIRQGRAGEGREDLQIAAARQPHRALFRSYLGKAWSNVHEDAQAIKELELARRLDPNDPTPWLYLALLKRQQNRINEAVRELEKSKDLNEHRSLFRSRLLLDQDRAVRAANLAQIYRDAGMIDVSRREATRAVESDYANFSAHLFLANSYNELRDVRQVNLRYETPAFNELLLANLLAPVGAGALSQNVSQQEYVRLFERNHVGLLAGAEYASAGDWFAYGSQFGTYDALSYSLDAIHRSQNGQQRANEDFSLETFHAKVKFQLTPQDSVYVHTIYYDNESGDVAQYYDASRAHRDLRVGEAQEPIVLAGFHHEWSPGMHTVLLAGRLVDTLGIRDPEQPALLVTRRAAGFAPVGQIDFNLDYRSELEIYSVELQQICQHGRNTAVSGVRYQNGSFDTRAQLANPSALGFLFPPNGVATAQVVEPDFQRISAYAYDYFRLWDALTLAAGLSYDQLEYPNNFRVPPLSEEEVTKERVSPKVGLSWAPEKNTTVRAAYTRSLGGVSLDQSIRLEPTQLASFNQTFRSLIPESVAGATAAAEFETAGVGVDHKFETGTYVGVDTEWLVSKVSRDLGAFAVRLAPPSAETEDVKQQLDYVERSLLVSVNQLVGDYVALGARYRLSHATLDDRLPRVAGTAAENGATLHQLNLYALLNCPLGIFARVDSLWTAQSNHEYSPARPGDDFWHFNAFVGYRFARRIAEVRVGVLNLGDQDYRLNPLSFFAELPRERTLVMSCRVSL
jgi:Tfp pilus assembly protein PilF